LLEPATDAQLAIAVRNGNFAFEATEFSAYVPAHGRRLLYGADDWLQREERAKSEWPAFAQTLERARDASLVTDWAYEHDRVAPAPTSSTTRPLAAVEAPAAPAL
jgi:hypothetical protein